MCANSYVCDYVKRVLILLIFVIKLVFAIYICFGFVFITWVCTLTYQRPMHFSIKLTDPG